MRRTIQTKTNVKKHLKISFRSFTFLLPDWLDLLSSRNALAYAMGPALTCSKNTRANVKGSSIL